MGLLLGILMMVNMVVGVLVLPAVINIIKPRFIVGREIASGKRPAPAYEKNV